MPELGVAVAVVVVVAAAAEEATGGAGFGRAMPIDARCSERCERHSDQLRAET